MAGAKRVAALALLVLTLHCAGFSELVRDGYFAGQNLNPVGSARTALLGLEPAAVLVFNPEGGKEALRTFDDWFRQSHGYEYPIYAVAVLAEGGAPDVLEEVLFQMEVKVPVFHTRNDLLRGRPSMALILERGDAVVLENANAESLERQMTRVAEAAGFVPVTVTRPRTDTIVTTAAATPAASPATDAQSYYNRRYDYSVRFPAGWTYRESQNGDGAVGDPPEDSALDLRVWAVQNTTNEDGEAGSMTMPEYLTRHFSFIADDSGSRVAAERRLVVQDGDLEGRDYTYSYMKSSARTRRSYQVRGRIAVFELRGIFRVVNAEGPAEEFARSTKLIDDFMLNFHPQGR